MNRTLVFSLAAFLIAGACSREDNLRRDQQQYEVVEEGQAGSVSATIAAPGEIAPPLVPLTGTNADTTTAFTLPNTGTMTTTAPPGSIAGTFPTQPSYLPYPSSPPRPRAGVPPPPPPPPLQTTSAATSPAPEAPAVQPEAPVVEPEAPPPPAPPTETAPPSEEKKPEEPQEEEKKQETPPPPPTSATDTNPSGW